MIRSTVRLLSLVAASGLAPVAFAAPAPLPTAVIDPARLSADIKVLASDAFEGRGPATPGEAKSVDYISRKFAEAGLQPGGDHGNWTQDVPLNRFETGGDERFTLTAGGTTRTLTPAEEIVAWSKIPTAQVSVENAPLVFVGYGVHAPERGWDDFKGADLHGKVAVVLINDPDFEALPGEPVAGKFGGKAMTYYGRWTYKYEEAARQGALGMLIVHETAPAAYGWGVVKNSNTIPQFDIVRTDPAQAHPLVEGWIQREVAVDLFRRSGLDFEAMKTAARRADFRPVPLKGATFSGRFGVTTTRIVSHNVIGRLPGAARPDETVIYSAHWDHLGIGPPAANGDRIYHGALDNGSGVAALIELARAFGAAPRTRRSLVFLAVTAEEKGLLGSEYYGRHPIYPLGKTVADLNMDNFLDAGPARDVGDRGLPQSTLDDLLAAAAVRQGRRFTPDGHLGEGSFYRADHFSFARRGVPAVTVNSGEDLVQGGREAGAAAHAAYTKQRYHQPTDVWSPGMNLDGVAQDVTLYYDLGRRLADGAVWPTWKPDSEFRAARQATAADRPTEPAAGN